MGSVLPPSEDFEIRIELTGEKPFKAVDLFRNGDLYKRYRPDDIEFSVTETITAPDTQSWYVRATQLDNHIAYSSPCFVQ